MFFGVFLFIHSHIIIEIQECLPCPFRFIMVYRVFFGSSEWVSMVFVIVFHVVFYWLDCY